MTTITTGGGIDWALIAAVVGNLALLLFAWRQFSETRKEARLSRRPVVEVRIRNELVILGSVESKELRTLAVEVTNKGEGPAIDLRIVGTVILDQGGLVFLGDANSIAKDLWNSPDALSSREEYLRPGDTLRRTLGGVFYTPFATLDEHGQRKPRPGHAVVDLRYSDVYGTEIRLSAPVHDWVSY